MSLNPRKFRKGRLSLSEASPWLARGAFFLYCGTYLYWAIAGYLSPIVNWDIVPYTAAALEKRIPADHLRTATFSDLRQFSSRHFPEQVDNNYQQSVMDSDKYLNAQLPFYQVKPLYVLLTRWLGDMTGSYSSSTVAISAIGFFFSGIAVWKLKPVSIHPAYWAAILLGFNFVKVPFSFVLLPSASTPDTLAGAFFRFIAPFRGMQP